MPWRYFAASEFACKGSGCCGGQSRMDPDFVDTLDKLRHLCGFPLVVTSGYRCPTHNQRVSTTGPAGPHTTGRAVDLAVDRKRAHEVIRIAFDLEITGIGWKQHGASRFVHLDDLYEADGHAPRPTIWTYP